MAANACRIALAPKIAEFVASQPTIQRTNILSDAVKRVIAAGMDTSAAREAKLFTVLGTTFKVPRFDPLRRLTASPVEKVRAFGKLLWDDRLGFESGQKRTVRELGKAIESELVVPVKQAFTQQGQLWAQRRGIRWVANEQAQLNFDKLVHRAITSGETNGVEPEVLATAKVWADETAKALKRQQELGLLDESIPVDPHHVPRVVHNGNLINKGKRFGWDGGDDAPETGGLLKVVHQAIMKAQDDIDPRLAQAIARTWLQVHRKRTVGLSPSFSQGIDLSDTMFMKELIDTGLKRIGRTQDEVDELRSLTDALVHRVATKAGKKSTVKHGKRRIDMDINLKTNIEGPDGPELVAVVDFLRTDLRHIAVLQAKTISGHMAFKKITGKAMTPGEKQRTLDDIRVAMGEDGIPRAEIEDTVLATDLMMREILGQPVNDYENALSGFTRFARGIRKWNTMTGMNLSGFASFTEYAFPMQRGVLRLLEHKVPAFGQFMRDAKTGQIDNHTLRFLELHTGEGAEDITRPGFNRIDDPDDATFGLHIEEDGSSIADKVERTLDKASHVSLEYVSLLMKMTRDTKRTAMLMQLDEFSILSADSKKFMNRAGELGMSMADARMVSKAVKKYSLKLESTLGDTKGMAGAVDLKKMRESDPDAFEALILALQRSSDRSVIAPTAADIPPIFRTTQIGKVIAQFQGFPMAAMTQHFTGPIARKDIAGFVTFSYAAMLAAMSTVALEVLNNAGRPEKLKENLTLSKVALRSIARSPHAGILPGIVDTIGNTMMGTPVFNATINGRPSGSLTSIPAIRTIDAASTAGGGIFRAITGQENLTQSTGRAVKAITPYGNAPVVGGIFNALTNDLPERK